MRQSKLSKGVIIEFWDIKCTFVAILSLFLAHQVRKFVKHVYLLVAFLAYTLTLQAQRDVAEVVITRAEFASLPSAYMAIDKNSSGRKLMLGLRAGAATANIAADEVTFQNAGRQFKLAADNNEFSYHLGVFAQFRMNKWAIQPEVLFRSARSDYMLSEFVSTEFVTSIRTEQYAYVDVPVMLAYRLGALRIQAGPEAKFYITSSTEFVGIIRHLALYCGLEVRWRH